jgi:hypothetical protein
VTLFLNQSQDTPKLCIHVVDADGNPVDLSPFPQVNFFLKRSWRDPDNAAIVALTLGNGVRLLTPTDDGVVEATIDASIVAALQVLRPYPWRLSIVSNIGETATPATGYLVINAA